MTRREPAALRGSGSAMPARIWRELTRAQRVVIFSTFGLSRGMPDPPGSRARGSRLLSVPELTTGGALRVLRILREVISPLRICTIYTRTFTAFIFVFPLKGVNQYPQYPQNGCKCLILWGKPVRVCGQNNTRKCGYQYPQNARRRCIATGTLFRLLPIF